MEPHVVLGAKVRSVREQRGWTQEQLGDRCDMDLSYISRVERGEKDVRLGTIVRLACGLGVTPATLIEDVGCPDPGPAS